MQQLPVLCMLIHQHQARTSTDTVSVGDIMQHKSPQYQLFKFQFVCKGSYVYCQAMCSFCSMSGFLLCNWKDTCNLLDKYAVGAALRPYALAAAEFSPHEAEISIALTHFAAQFQDYL